jgi:hypothetical protein
VLVFPFTRAAPPSLELPPGCSPLKTAPGRSISAIPYALVHSHDLAREKLYLGGAYRRVLSGHHGLEHRGQGTYRAAGATALSAGGREGARLEEQATARLRQIEQQIDDLRASLE